MNISESDGICLSLLQFNDEMFMNYQTEVISMAFFKLIDHNWAAVLWSEMFAPVTRYLHNYFQLVLSMPSVQVVLVIWQQT